MKKSLACVLFMLLFAFMSFAAPRQAPAQATAIQQAAKPAPTQTARSPPGFFRDAGHHQAYDHDRVKPLSYTAACGMMPIREDGKTTAHIFYIVYTKDGVADRESRPILFSFNGGPGSASVWMHLGLTVPRVVLTKKKAGADASLPDGRQRASLLDVTDLVFIDPVGTGYSRMMPDEAPAYTTGCRKTRFRSGNSSACMCTATIAGPRRSLSSGKATGLPGRPA